MSSKSMTGTDDVSIDGGGSGGVPTGAPITVWTTVGTAGLTNYELLVAGDSMTLTNTGGLGTATFALGTSAQLGAKIDTIGKAGILDINLSSSAANNFTGLPATNNSVIVVGNNNTLSGTARGTVALGDTNTFAGNNANCIFSGYSNSFTTATDCHVSGNNNSLNNVTDTNVGGISHVLSGALANATVTGYNNTITGGSNMIVGGQQNTVTSGVVVAVLGHQNSVSNTTGATVNGQSNNISGGTNNHTFGRLNAITTGIQCSCVGYNNAITGGNDCLIEGYANQFNGGVTNDVNILKGYNVQLIGGLNHRFNMWLCPSNGAAGRAATTYNGSLLIATGVPTAASAFDNGGVTAPPVGYDSNNTVAIYGDRIVMDCNNAGEMRCIGVNNLRSANAPTTGDDYCNKTYVDSMPSVVSTTNRDFWIYDNGTFNITFAETGGNYTDAFYNFAGAYTVQYNNDPYFMLVNPGTGIGRVTFSNGGGPMVRNVLAEFKAGMRWSANASEPGIIYITLHYNGSSIAELCRINGNLLIGPNYVTPVSGFVVVSLDASVLTPTLDLYFEVTGGDNNTHQISFDSASVKYTVLAQ